MNKYVYPHYRPVPQVPSGQNQKLWTGEIQRLHRRLCLPWFFDKFYGGGQIINSQSLSNLVGLYQRTIIVARHGGKIAIGERCGISGSTIYAMQEINIGRDVLIGGNCKIIDNDFHPLQNEKRHPQHPEDIKKRPITIGDGCFIGANSIILKGTTLGKNCVVGAGSVVHGTWPDNSIIAGNPAKLIGRNE